MKVKQVFDIYPKNIRSKMMLVRQGASINLRSKANTQGFGYQILINQILKNHTNSSSLNEGILRKIIREELKGA